MVLLAAGFAALAWERLQDLPYHLGPLAIGVFALSILLAVYAYGRRKEVGELKVLLKDLQDHVGAAPSEDQLDQLNDLIARSQRSFKELIDSFDDAACAVSLNGTFRTVNKSISDLVGLPYTAIVGHKFYEFIDEPARATIEAGLVRFLEKRTGRHRSPQAQKQLPATLLRLRSERHPEKRRSRRRERFGPRRHRAIRKGTPLHANSLKPCRKAHTSVRPEASCSTPIPRS